MNIIKTVIIPDASLPLRIKILRKEDGRSVKELALLAEVSTSYWYDIESGKRENISEEVLRKIENVLGKTINPIYKVPIKFD